MPPGRKRGQFSRERLFVAQHPDTPSRELSQLAARSGLVISVKDVSRIRYRIARDEARGRPMRPTRAAPTAPVRQAAATETESPKEAQFRQLLFALGYDRVAELLEEYRQLVEAQDE